MEAFLGLGFLIGMAHALEADHLAALGALSVSDGADGRRAMTLRGAAWGLGHTLTLLVICTAVLLLGLSLTDTAAATMEMAVGIMLLALGLFVAHRLYRPDAHVGSHALGGRSRRSAIRALSVGLVHGAAGSAGLLALSLAATSEPWQALGYVVLFGMGSVVGMSALTFLASWPLGWVERSARWLHRPLLALSAGAACFVGVGLIVETAPIAFAGLG